MPLSSWRFFLPRQKNYDCGDKSHYYQALPSFCDYLLISQDEIKVKHHVRQPDDTWEKREYTSLSDEIRLPSIDCRLRLDVVYERVRFDEAPDRGIAWSSCINSTARTMPDGTGFRTYKRP